MKNKNYKIRDKRYKTAFYVLLILFVIFLLFAVNFILKLYGPSFPVSHETREKFQSNLDYVKTNFSSLSDFDIKLKFSNTSNFVQPVGSAESYRLLVEGFQITIDPKKFEKISDDAIRGFFAHELSHLEDYSSLSWPELIFYSLHYYFSDDFQVKVERETDINVIEKGFAYELLAYREYRLQTADTEDVLFIEKRYLSPEEIKNLAEIN